MEKWGKVDTISRSHDNPDMPAFTGPGSLKFPEPDFPAESRRLSLFYVFIAATFLGLAGLDLYLRRRRHNAMKTNGHPHR